MEISGTPKVSNPLTMIAVFAGLAEVAATIALPKLDPSAQRTFLWFVMGFPTLLVVLFFITLWARPGVLYGPGDYKDERLFIETIKGSFVATGADEKKLRDFWKKDDASAEKLREWLEARSPDVSIPAFLYQGAYDSLRKQAVKALGL